MDRLMQRVGTGKPFNMTQESTFYAWDVMGDLAFSEDFRMLQYEIQNMNCERNYSGLFK